MSRTPLPSGGWVELRDPATLKTGDRDDYLETLAGRSDGWTGNVEVRNHQIAIIVEGWSFDLPLPAKDRLSVRELAPADTAALIAWWGDHVDPVLFPDAVKENDPADPKAASDN